MQVKKTGRRRVSTDAVAGSDPTPQTAPPGSTTAPTRAAEDTDEAWGAAPAASPARASEGPNDDRLRRDVPPHW
ncbi:hypothetical protein [Herbiconiux sp. A18JL235]|uniref:Uncharacterized protein n=1 Tax=Herbiconiux sp. A18JL235 TaxID=3152363 RepID=A0AB39BDV0_9MICO